MKHLKRRPPLTIVFMLIAILSPLRLPAADTIENAGMGIGLTAGNMLFVPLKGISLFWGLTAGGLSFLLSGGNAELTKQIWNDVTEGPYLITPEVARKGIGERPELEKQ